MMSRESAEYCICFVWNLESGDQDCEGDRDNQSAGRLMVISEKHLDGSVVGYILLANLYHDIPIRIPLNCVIDTLEIRSHRFP